MPLQKSSPARILIGVAVIGAVTCSVVAARVLRKPTPRPFAVAESNPLDIHQSGAYWYWVERPAKAKAKLIRASERLKDVLASADEIVGYSVADHTLVWSERDGAAWTVKRNIDGRTDILFTGTTSTGTPAISANRVVWPVVRNGSFGDPAIPALGPSIELHVAESGHPTRVVGRLLESNAGVIGVHGETAYAVCLRNQGNPQTVIYAISLTDGSAQRIAAEEGLSHVALLANGDLAWTALSRDSSSRELTACVCSLTPGHKSTVRADWLPPHGHLYVDESHLYYAEGLGDRSMFAIGSEDKLADRIEPPPGFVVYAVGERAILLQKTSVAGNSVSLHTVPRL